MSIELNKQEICITDDKCSASVKAITESDIIVPDSKSDCIEILEVNPLPVISEKYVSKDYITLTGNLNYKILYSGEEGKVESIEYSAPFSKQIDAAGSEEGMSVYVKCFVSHIEYSVINSRKINVKSVMNVKAKAWNKSSAALVDCVEGDVCMPVRTKKVNSFNMVLCSDRNFSVNESVKLPGASPDIDNILKYEVKIADTELKVVSNKVIARGNILLNTLYTNEGEIYSVQNEIPFTHIADVEGILSDMYCTSDYEIKNIICKKNLDEDGSMSLIEFNADMCLIIRAYDEKEVEFISDVYSPDFEIDVEKKDIFVTEMIDAQTGQCTVSQSCGADTDVEKIYSVTSKVLSDKVEISGNSVVVSGNLKAVVLYRGMSDSVLRSMSADIPFSCDMPISRVFESENAFADADAFVEHESYSIEGGNSIKLRFIIRVNSTVKCNYNISAVTDISVDENKKTDKSSQSGITVYFVQNGDDMWNIAKRYHTMPSDIVSVNSLDENALLYVGQQLLIPKRS